MSKGSAVSLFLEIQRDEIRLELDPLVSFFLFFPPSGLSSNLLLWQQVKSNAWRVFFSNFQSRR